MSEFFFKLGNKINNLPKWCRRWYTKQHSCWHVQ